MIIYKITNELNRKVYIGQTTFTLEHRKRQHLQCAKNRINRHLYNAMNKYGVEHFIFEQIDTAKDLDELNYLESYYITKYDSVRKGYNMGYGGDNNVMFSEKVKTKHDTVMRSAEVRSKISKTLKDYRKKYGFSPEHLRKISEAQKGKKFSPERCKLCDTRSVGCYCIEQDGTRHDFHSYRDAWKWWSEVNNPFNTKAECIYQRKIKQSIKFGYYKYGRNGNIFQYPKWYRLEKSCVETTEKQ